MAIDPYQILGVTKSASQEDIKKAYRKLAKKYHPDLNPGNTQYEEKFKEVSTAFNLIGKEENRRKFDQGKIDEDFFKQASQGSSGPYYYQTQTGGGRYSRNVDNMEDILKDLFGSKFRNQTSSGENHYYQTEIGFKDAVLGGSRELKLRNDKTLRVKIPAGIESGTQLRFPGQGGPGIGSGKAGDAFVEITVRPSPLYRRNGSDLETDLPLSLDEALLGAEITVPTIDGSIRLKIPKGTNTGTRLRARGKGIKIAKDNPGDQIYIAKIMLPQTPDPNLEDAIRNWRRNHHYNPRPENRS